MTTILPDGSAFSVLSLPLPKDHWLYAPRCAEWDEARDTTADTPHPILTHAQHDAVVAAVRYAVRGATMCGTESDFDPDALVQNAVYALCGPYGARAALATTEAPMTDAIAPTEGGARRCQSCGNDVAPGMDADHEDWCSELGWKKRALEAEELNRKFMASVNGPMHMGEPVIAAPSPKPAVDALTTGAVDLSDEWIELYAQRHIAPHAERMKKALGLNVPYQQTEQFKRIKAYTKDVIAAAHPASEPKAAAIHYPECWDTATYPTVESALSEVYAAFKCTNHIGASEPKALTPAVINAIEACASTYEMNGLHDTAAGIRALLADRGSRIGAIMSEQEALQIWNQSGKGQTFWTFEFARAVERETLRKALTILEKYGLSNDQTAIEIRALAASDGDKS